MPPRSPSQSASLTPPRRGHAPSPQAPAKRSPSPPQQFQPQPTTSENPPKLFITSIASNVSEEDLRAEF